MSSRHPLDLTSLELSTIEILDTLTGERSRLPARLERVNWTPSGDRSFERLEARVRTTDGHYQTTNDPLYACRVPGCPHRAVSGTAARVCTACASIVCATHAGTTPEGVTLCAPCLEAARRQAFWSYVWSLTP